MKHAQLCQLKYLDIRLQSFNYVNKLLQNAVWEIKKVSGEE